MTVPAYALQVLLQPRHRLRVEVVRRLVEQEDVRLGQQQPGERDPAPLAAGEHADGRIAGRTAQRLHRLFEAVVQVPGVVLVQLFLQLALLLDQRVEVRVRLAERVGDLVELLQQCRRSAAPLPRSPGARSCSGRAPAPGSAARGCSPSRASFRPGSPSSTPAMMRSSVLLPAPFRPSTPILAP